MEASSSISSSISSSSSSSSPLDSSTSSSSPVQAMQWFDEMRPHERAEMVYLALVGTAAAIINAIVFVRLLRQSRSPTAQTSFMAGPYHISSFTLFKLNLCISDFLIIIVHVFGKVLWMAMFTWEWGDEACKAYMFLSIFSYYANSNVVVAIGVDRLKVVYTSHIQGAASVRRVRGMVLVSWVVAALCSLPQLLVWRTYEPPPREELPEGFISCTDVFKVMADNNETTALSRQIMLLHEMFHQAAVFWIPFVILAISYLLIVFKLLHFTLRPVHCSRVPASTSSVSSTSRLLNVLDMKPRAETASYHFMNESIALDSMATSSTAFSDDSPPPTRSFRSLRKASSGMLRKISRAPLVCSGGSGERRVPLWRKQLRSRIFLTALLVVVAHIAMWLPYNVLSTMKVIDSQRFGQDTENWEMVLEDLIILNTLINPLLYSCN